MGSHDGPQVPSSQDMRRDAAVLVFPSCADRRFPNTAEHEAIPPVIGARSPVTRTVVIARNARNIVLEVGIGVIGLKRQPRVEPLVHPHDQRVIA